MKKLIILSLCLLSASLYAQQESALSGQNAKTWKLGFLSGASFSDKTGISGVVEFKTRYLMDNLYTKISIAYAQIMHNENYTLRDLRRRYINPETEEYVLDAYSHEIQRTTYNSFPISLGAEYYFMQEDVSPYALLELGININDVDVRNYGEFTVQTYDTYEEVPPEFKDLTSKPLNGLRLGIGGGTNIRLVSNINLDVRAVYQMNDKIGNYAQLLAGITF